MFSHNSSATQQEKELLKYVQDTELNQVMMGNAKLQTPGLHATTKNQKKQKKVKSQSDD